MNKDQPEISSNPILNTIPIAVDSAKLSCTNYLFQKDSSDQSDFLKTDSSTNNNYNFYTVNRLTESAHSTALLPKPIFFANTILAIANRQKNVGNSNATSNLDS